MDIAIYFVNIVSILYRKRKIDIEASLVYMSLTVMFSWSLARLYCCYCCRSRCLWQNASASVFVLVYLYTWIESFLVTVEVWMYSPQSLCSSLTSRIENCYRDQSVFMFLENGRLYPIVRTQNIYLCATVLSTMFDTNRRVRSTVYICH